MQGEGQTPRLWREWVAVQQQQATENAHLFQHHQKTLVEQLVTTQTGANRQIWEQVAKALEGLKGGGGSRSTGGTQPVQPVVRVLKMTSAGDPEAFLNTFECAAMVAGCLQDQWTSVLIPYPIGPAQQAMDTLPTTYPLTTYTIKAVILQMLNISLEAYQHWLWEIEFGPDYHPQLTGQQI